MIRSIVVTALVTLVFSADVSAAGMRGTLPTGKNAEPLPPGPHFILTVPVTLHNIPPEVDQYEVSCVVFAPPYEREVGHGTVSAAISNTGGKPGVDFNTEATVGVAVTEGDMVTLESVSVYRCRLYLRGTAYGITTTYLADDRLPYQQGESLFPLAPGAPYKRFIRAGQIPRESLNK